VFTIKGTKWITTVSRLKEIGIKEDEPSGNGENNNQNSKKLCFVFEKLSEEETEGHINLGWLYLPYKLDNNEELKNKILEILEKPNPLQAIQCPQCPVLLSLFVANGEFAQ